MSDDFIIGPLVKPRKNTNKHHDMIAAMEYAKNHNKQLKDLTEMEMKQFEVVAKPFKPDYSGFLFFSLQNR